MEEKIEEYLLENYYFKTYEIFQKEKKENFKKIINVTKI